MKFFDKEIKRLWPDRHDPIKREGLRNAIRYARNWRNS